MKILIAGESGNLVYSEIKGFDVMALGGFESGVEWLQKGLEQQGAEVDYLPNHLVPTCFPTTMEELRQYNVIFLSDVGSNSLLLHPDTYHRSLRTPNRLKLLKQYVEDGGGLAMVGGYLSFSGLNGMANWGSTAVGETLPVTMQMGDDRVEVPEGFSPRVVNTFHPIVDGLGQKWPWFLGYNKLTLKGDAQVLLEFEGDPVLAVQQCGKGRTGIFASDCAPHWASREFLEWEYYGKFWHRFASWLAGEL